VAGDVRDFATVERTIRDSAPDIIFHLAAQSLVRRSYREPMETYATNFMGTVHVLEACRRIGRPCSVVVITSDKCYENPGHAHAFVEDDPLGGHDPYSSSKGATELVVSGYGRSFFSQPASPVRIASARAGNVVGGGDWSDDRLVPDCVRALQRGEPIPVRNKASTRPWQHVLEPLSGYLLLGAELHRRLAGRLPSPVAFNFGPKPESTRTVRDLVEEMLRHWPGRWEDRTDPGAPHEAVLLSLATEKAWQLLGWRPVWDFATTIRQTADWYRECAARNAADTHSYTRAQLDHYVAAARAHGLAWAT
jgi:CDP-glucose 4,6-dehydratase